MALQLRTNNPYFDNPFRFVGKLLILPGRFNSDPLLFFKFCWDDDGEGFEAFFLYGEKVVKYYTSRSIFFEYAWLAEDFVSSVEIEKPF